MHFLAFLWLFSKPTKKGQKGGSGWPPQKRPFFGGPKNRRFVWSRVQMTSPKMKKGVSKSRGMPRFWSRGPLFWTSILHICPFKWVGFGDRSILDPRHVEEWGKTPISGNQHIQNPPKLAKKGQKWPIFPTFNISDILEKTAKNH